MCGAYMLLGWRPRCIALVFGFGKSDRLELMRLVLEPVDGRTEKTREADTE